MLFVQRYALHFQTIVSGVRPTSAPTYPHHCYTGYCEFVRCIRRINANVLVCSYCTMICLPLSLILNIFNSLSIQVDNCLLENIGRNLTMQQDRVNFYTNITSCILARTRCNAYNPITGELQTPTGFSSGFHSQTNFLSNALQITTTGDLRIVSFAQKVGVSNLFCSAQKSLDQSGYGVTVC